MTRFDSSYYELVAPVGFEPYVAGVKGRLPYQLEEGTKMVRADGLEPPTSTV